MRTEIWGVMEKFQITTGETAHTSSAPWVGTSTVLQENLHFNIDSVRSEHATWLFLNFDYFLYPSLSGAGESTVDRWYPVSRVCCRSIWALLIPPRHITSKAVQSDQNTFLILPPLALHLKPTCAYLIGHPLSFICNSNEIDTCPANLTKPCCKQWVGIYKGRKVL